MRLILIVPRMVLDAIGPASPPTSPNIASAQPVGFGLQLARVHGVVRDERHEFFPSLPGHPGRKPWAGGLMGAACHP